MADASISILHVSIEVSRDHDSDAITAVRVDYRHLPDMTVRSRELVPEPPMLDGEVDHEHMAGGGEPLLLLEDPPHHAQAFVDYIHRVLVQAEAG